MVARLELEDIQGLVARGYGTLPAATFVLLRIERPERAGSWLATLADQVATAERARPADAVQVALTASGLRRIGLPDGVLAGFPVEFTDGMTAPHRRRILGDEGESAPEHWHWGGPSDPVDAVLLLYAGDQARLAELADRQAGPAALAAAGLAQVRRLATAPLGETEPFGFRDGLSQPLIAELGPPGRPGPSQHIVPAGEFVLGYDNAYGQRTGSPGVAPADDPAGLLPRTGHSGLGDLGRNGSYLVLRQLGQDVDRFWRFMDQASGGAGRAGPDGEAGPSAAVRLAAKLVGRWPDGTPLARAPAHPAPELAGDNDFGYARSDAAGLGCPVGAHIRRANPRDALDLDAGPERSVQFANRHRLLRRGRAYGDPAEPDGQGIHFLCLNANIARQFEFVQHTWLNNPKFGALYDDTDPIVATRQGDDGRTFTVQARPVRHRVIGLPSFVTVRGGAYFFLPGRRALQYLATLLGTRPARRMP
jgi:deferrochelatase/peroxidase EfeB